MKMPKWLSWLLASCFADINENLQYLDDQIGALEIVNQELKASLSILKDELVESRKAEILAYKASVNLAYQERFREPVFRDAPSIPEEAFRYETATIRAPRIRGRQAVQAQEAIFQGSSSYVPITE